MTSPKIKECELNRICVSLQAEDKGHRKRALEEIERIVIEGVSSWEVKDLEIIWEILHRPLIRLLNDQAEACRDRTINILKTLLNALPISEKHIIYVLPILSRRLSPQEIIESSEEVRLNCITLLRIIVSKYKKHLPIYLNDLIGILARTVTDSYPNVKKESCECISELAKTIPRQFYTQSENLVKPVLSNFNHQHYRVRVAAIKTIGNILLYGNSKSMEEVATPLAERLFDQSGAVRAAVVEVAGSWLVELRDRYSWWYKIIPLVMTGLHDEIEEIRINAAKLWDAAGRLYMKENEEDEKVKNKMDFLEEELDHYPPNLRRPNLGCRIIAQQNLCKLVNGIGAELGDWMADIRVRSAQLLCVLILNVEENVTQHIEKLLPPMYRACNDEDRRVAENVELAAEYLGYFVPPEIYCHLVLPTLEDSPSAGHLRVLAAILKGTERNALAKHLDSIGGFLQRSHICQSRKTSYQYQLLHCCDSLFTVCKVDCTIISQELFTVMFTMLSMAADEQIHKEAYRLLTVLCSLEKLADLNELFISYMRPLLLENNCESWTVYTAEYQIFRGCFLHAPATIGDNIDLVLPILKEITSSNADPEMRLKFLILLADYFSNGQQAFRYIKNLSQTMKSIIENTLLPGLVWSAGKAAETVRTAAVSCLCALLEHDADSRMNQRNITIKDDEDDSQRITIFSTEECFLSLFESVNPILVTLVDDNAKKTRLYSLRAICLLMAIGQKLYCIREEHIHKTYPVILKRLDDGCDTVRRGAVEALVEVWCAKPEDYDLLFYKSHVDALYTTMIIHLDDPETSFQELMLEALLHLTKIHPEMLFHKLQNSRTNFRNQSGIDKLLDHCQTILRNN